MGLSWRRKRKENQTMATRRVGAEPPGSEEELSDIDDEMGKTDSEAPENDLEADRVEAAEDLDPDALVLLMDTTGAGTLPRSVQQVIASYLTALPLVGPQGRLVCPVCPNGSGGIEAHEEGWTCNTCIRIWQTCERCDNAEDPDSKAWTPERIHSTSWMQLQQWRIGRGAQRLPPYRPFIAGPDTYYMDDQSVFRWRCRKCRHKRTTNCD
jgi:hypothetical protein